MSDTRQTAGEWFKQNKESKSFLEVGIGTKKTEEIDKIAIRARSKIRIVKRRSLTTSGAKS